MKPDHFLFLFLAFVLALGVYTALGVLGSDGLGTATDLVKILAGALAGAALPKS
jgi:hypothetical protein